jgi:hypothetical protein
MRLREDSGSQQESESRRSCLERSRTRETRPYAHSNYLGEGPFEGLPHRVLLARGDETIVRPVLLQHEVHGPPHEVAGVARVAQGIEVAQIQTVLQRAQDAAPHQAGVAGQVDTGVRVRFAGIRGQAPRSTPSRPLPPPRRRARRAALHDSADRRRKPALQRLKGSGGQGMQGIRHSPGSRAVDIGKIVPQNPQRIPAGLVFSKGRYPVCDVSNPRCVRGSR